MKAAFIRKYGGPDVIEFDDIEDPQIDDNSILVRVKAASVNSLDAVVRVGGYKQFVKKFPHILGVDFSGIVEKVGEKVNTVTEGQKVIGFPILHDNSCEYCKEGYENLCKSFGVIGRDINGSYAELISIPKENVMPFDWDYIQASTIQLSLLTAWHALTKRVQLKEGMNVFIWGGSGGVGTFAIQIAKLFKSNVITTTSEEWKAKKLKEIGADLVINYKEQDVLNEVMDYTNGRGVDVVFDSLGPDTLNTSIKITGKGGDIIVLGVGIKESDLTPINLRNLYIKYIRVHGTVIGTKKDLKQVTNLVKEGKIKPVIDSVFNLKDVSVAHKKLEKGERVGKIVLTIS
ncbi:MAG: zinc-binding dehydrogenase [Saccharolobus sp.]|uniref:zinc-binding dehydrogenase n=2 Tax=Sulfolobaceae TaxID=118883 RepID=UPI001F10560A|nr:zinc-binding dehydrogenase [Saccharolobus shibatae]MCH4815773.1 zinc-binding dehydrogenase [Saccharolobus shibatae]